MAFLVIDIGNSYIKTAVFVQDELAEFDHYALAQPEALSALISKYQIQKAIISSVKKNKEAWELNLAKQITLLYFGAAMAAGINNHYRTPFTLGLDRLAAVTAAHHLYRGCNNLVIDSGTCIKYDWVDAFGNYYGGSISPGLQMRYKALNYYTDGLPLVNADENFKSPYGDDTRTAIVSGVQNGIFYELKGFIESYRVNGTATNIILSGGDGIFFDSLLKNSIFAPYIKNEPYLVLKGLNVAIQQHND